MEQDDPKNQDKSLNSQNQQKEAAAMLVGDQTPNEGKKEINQSTIAEGKENAKIKVNKKKINKIKPAFRTPRLLWRLAIAIIMGLILIGGIIISNKQLDKLVGESEQKRSQLIALSKKDDDFKKLSSVLNMIGEEIKKIQEALPDENRIVEIISQVESMKEESGVDIKTFKFTEDHPRSDGKGNYYLELNIEASGQLQSLEKFSEIFLRLPVLLRVKDLAITKMDEPVSQMNLKVWIYVEADFFQEVKK